MQSDLRAAWRSLAKSPGFVAVAVLALALGLALSTTMFGVVDAILQPRSPYRNWDRLYWVNSRILTRVFFDRRNLIPIIRERTRSFDAAVARRSSPAPASVGPDAREFQVMAVPPSWFDTYGIRPTLGRAFTAGDGENVADVSDDVWRVLSGGRHSLAGAHVIIADRVCTVIGVLPRGAFDVVVPLAPADEAAVDVFQVLRLAPGASPEQAQAELNALAKALTARYGVPGAPWSLKLQALSRRAEQIQDIQKAMVGSGLAVLLIACVNLAHLMLARGLAKRRELAIRMALGAGRVAAVRLMLAEGLLIMAGGVALGAVGAVWGSGFAQRLMPPDITWISFIRFQLSWRVFAAGAAAAMASGILFGLLPAIRVATSVELTDPLKTEAGTTTGRRRRRYSPLVIAEVALALALMMGGGLLLRSVHELRAASPGFEAETLVKASVFANPTIRQSKTGSDSVTVDWAQALAAVRAVPGVQDAALEGAAVAAGGAVTAELTGDSTRVINGFSYTVVSPSYLRVHGLPVLQGRDFAAGDGAGNGAAILSTVAAARLYPRGNAVGRMLKLGSPRSAAPWIPIVGVARTPIVPWEEQSLRGGEPVFWVAGPPGKWFSGTLLVREESRRPQILIDLRSVLRAQPQARFVTAQPYTWQRDAEIASRNFLAQVFVVMGAVGLALAALGLYGVLAYEVSRRMREFAVRVALGAEPGALYRMVMHDGLVMLLAGTGAGAFLALASAYLFNAVLIGVYPTDALSLVAAEAVLLAVGLAATLAPARRAVRANPLDILRAV